MKASPGQTCCVCGAPAVSCNLADDGFCAKHLRSWQRYYTQTFGISLETAFQQWLARERAAQRQAQEAPEAPTD